jgi:hypothetical protein
MHHENLISQNFQQVKHLITIIQVQKIVLPAISRIIPIMPHTDFVMAPAAGICPSLAK